MNTLAKFIGSVSVMRMVWCPPPYLYIAGGAISWFPKSRSVDSERPDIPRRAAEAKASVMIYKVIRMVFGHQALQRCVTKARTITQSSAPYVVPPIRLDTKRMNIASTAIGRHMKYDMATWS